MGNPRCKWVRDRLPLLAGEELRGADLRRVERHLIGCPKCRHHRTALDQALGVLHAASSHSPAPHDAPSLWPGLARQIRESRRPAQTPLFSWPRLGWVGPAFACGLGLALIAAAIAVGARGPSAPSGTTTASRSTPAVLPPPPAPPALPSEAPDPGRGEPASKPQTDTVSVDIVPASRMGYDLDHARPIGNTEVREKTH